MADETLVDGRRRRTAARRRDRRRVLPRDRSVGGAIDVAALRVNRMVAVEIASAYLETPIVGSALVGSAYAQLAIESDRLFAAITSPARPDSIRVRFSTCAQPYDTAEELIASVRDDRLLEVTAARTDHDRKHPLFDCAVGGTFDRFRAVHDILGHARLGAGFDRHGEYATWRYQERFHTALARRSLATELHAKHSVRWTSGDAPDHRPILLEEGLLRRSRRAGVPR